jgi:hypothetical protein
MTDVHSAAAAAHVPVIAYEPVAATIRYIDVNVVPVAAV